MKILVIVAIVFEFMSASAFAADGSKVCKMNAEKYTQAFSAVSFGILEEGKATVGSAKFIQSLKVSNGIQEIYEIDSTGSNVEAIHCIYQVKMLKNVTNHCWAESIIEMECGG